MGEETFPGFGIKCCIWVGMRDIAPWLSDDRIRCFGVGRGHISPSSTGLNGRPYNTVTRREVGVIYSGSPCT